MIQHDAPTSNSQCGKILRHLRRRPLTALQALQMYGCARLAARINDLRRAGYAIDTETVNVRTRQGGTARVARYRMARGAPA